MGRERLTTGLADAVPTVAFGGMRAVLLTNDPVALSFAEVVLRRADIDCVVLDAATSAMEGSIGAIPRRLAVADDDADIARRVLKASGLDPYDG
jgi:hypothetical protein